jgi:hypothetical protein
MLGSVEREHRLTNLRCPGMASVLLQRSWCLRLVELLRPRVELSRWRGSHRIERLTDLDPLFLVWAEALAMAQSGP